MRSRRDDLSTNQATAASNNLREIGGCYVPLLSLWCAELLPEIADEEEVRFEEINSHRDSNKPLDVFVVCVMLRCALCSCTKSRLCD